MPPVGRLLIFLGILLVLTGLVVILVNKVFPLGKLPGDITIEKDNFKFYFPFTTGLLVSGVLSGLALLITLLF